MKPILNHPNLNLLYATRVSILMSVILVVSTLLGTGCRREAKTASADSSTGTYALASIDGKQVPCTISHDGTAPLIKSGSFVINSDGTCVSKMVFSVPPGREATREVKATYTRAGTTLTMRWEGAGMTTGTLEGDRFTMNNEGMVLAYRK
jgi:hypothetical protein